MSIDLNYFLQHYKNLEKLECNDEEWLNKNLRICVKLISKEDLLKHLDLFQNLIKLIINQISNKKNYDLLCVLLSLLKDIYLNIELSHLIDKIDLFSLFKISTSLINEWAINENNDFLDLIYEFICFFEKILHRNKSLQVDIFEFDFTRSLVSLLPSDHYNLVNASLRLLARLTENESHKKIIAQTSSIEHLLLILQNYDNTFKRLSAIVLRSLLTLEDVKQIVKIFDGVTVLINLLQCEDIKLLWNVVSCLVLMVSDPEVVEEVVRKGGVPLIIAILQDEYLKNQTAHVDCKYQDKVCVEIDPFISLRSVCCACLTELVMDEEACSVVVQHNAIQCLASLLFTKQSNLTDADKLQAYALRTLRFIFSIDKYRHQIRKIFSSQIYDMFIGIGHHIRDIRNYTSLVDFINNLSKEDLEELKLSLSLVKLQNIKYISEYAIIEIIGSGSFGTVYKVHKKSNSDQVFALKEIKYALSKSNPFPHTELSVIYERLHHPNIVRYHKSFNLVGQLYILMDFLEGCSLEDTCISLSEKSEFFQEARIWDIFIQLIMGLRYLHIEKQIVHRDLKPSNIILGRRDHVTITDFGLARLRPDRNFQMESVVGTAQYSCPEIMRNEKYGDKADIWSLGCILYQMCQLRPAFQSENILSLVKKIVDASYEPLSPGRYSVKMIQIISVCLIKNHEDRADISCLTGLLSDHILNFLDKTRRDQAHFQRKYEKERLKRSKLFPENHKDEEEYLVNLNKENSDLQLLARDHSVTTTASENEFDTDEDVLSFSNSASSSSKLFQPKPPDFLRSISQGYRSHDKLLVKSTFINSTNSLFCDNLRSSNSTPALPSNSAAGDLIRSTPLYTNLFVSGERHRRENIRIQPRSRPSSFTLGQAMDMNRIGSFNSGKHRTCVSACSAITMNARLLRPVIIDPIIQVLEPLHKIIFITQLPPSQSVNIYRRIVDCFKKEIFSPNSSPNKLKHEIHKLNTCSKEVVSTKIPGLHACLEHLISSRYSEKSEMNLILQDSCLTYEALLNIINHLAEINGYRENQNS